MIPAPRERPERPVRLVRRARLVQRVRLVRLARRVRLDLLVPRAQPGRRVLRVRPA